MIFSHLDAKEMGQLRQISTEFQAMVNHLSNANEIKFRSAVLATHKNTSVENVDILKVLHALMLIEKQIDIKKGLALLKEEAHHPLVHYHIPRYFLRDNKHHYSKEILNGMTSFVLDMLKDNNGNNFNKCNNFVLAASLYRDGLYSRKSGSFCVIVSKSHLIAHDLMKKALEASGRQELLTAQSNHLGNFAGPGIEALLQTLEDKEMKLLSAKSLACLSRFPKADKLVSEMKCVYGNDWSGKINSMSEDALMGLGYFSHTDLEFKFLEDNIKKVESLGQNIVIDNRVKYSKLRPLSLLITQLGTVHDLGIKFAHMNMNLDLWWMRTRTRQPPLPENIKALYECANTHLISPSEINSFLSQVKYSKLNLLTNENTTTILKNMNDASKLNSLIEDDQPIPIRPDQQAQVNADAVDGRRMNEDEQNSPRHGPNI